MVDSNRFRLFLVAAAAVGMCVGCGAPPVDRLNLLPYPQQASITGKLRTIGRLQVELSAQRPFLETAARSAVAYAEDRCGAPPSHPVALQE